MPRLTLHTSKIEIKNTPTERRYLDRIKEEYSFEEDELHLFCWYMGYRFCLSNFRNIDGKRFRIVDDDEYGRGFYQGWDNVIFCNTGFLHQQCELAVAVRNG